MGDGDDNLISRVNVNINGIIGAGVFSSSDLLVVVAGEDAANLNFNDANQFQFV